MDEMSFAESYRDAQEKLMTLNLLQIAFKEIEGLESMQSALEKNGVEVSIANLSRYKNGKAIPKSKLKSAAKKPGKLGQRARFAITLGKLRKK